MIDKGYILDSYPNTVEQAQLLESYDIFPTNVVYCSLNDKDIYLRMRKHAEEHVKKTSTVNIFRRGG